ncbi:MULTISPECIES: DUF1192 family protein [Caulobacter]|jgi:uncharacterized small protein (DUF1192 family)|uniref:Putative small protein containing a coiled-coil domain containing protein n=1 Tax=Caulobacter vibrioides OR37 TaxID=1292034 RepID=R0ECL3_CAUVI|nr:MULTISPECIES: DUF1192 family protein [Caulobacter]ENZ83173.1 putative small protein containing a coiled-coil domain containing protein [Caulobacter vibrioides OR37]MBQ1561879.1 DUF1192 family protein [Caulobacter sp.]
MFEEPAEPRAFSGRALGETTHEDLEVYGVSELEQRILTLQAEIERTKAQLAKKKAGRDAANALFGRLD